MIYLPPPQPVLNKDIRVSGDVEIHPTASIAPGVILQAAPNHRIFIGADVCIGMGVIINACQGSVEIGDGAILGSGVLIIGACKIGNNACVGTAVTIFQTNVEATLVIEPGSVLGDNSRQINTAQDEQSKTDAVNSSSQSNKNSVNGKKASSNYNPHPSVGKTVAQSDRQNPSHTTTSSAETTVQPETKESKKPVVGEVYINQLLVTLFPHNQDFGSKAKKLE